MASRKPQKTTVNGGDRMIPITIADNEASPSRKGDEGEGSDGEPNDPLASAHSPVIIRRRRGSRAGSSTSSSRGGGGIFSAASPARGGLDAAAASAAVLQGQTHSFTIAMNAFEDVRRRVESANNNNSYSMTNNNCSKDNAAASPASVTSGGNSSSGAATRPRGRSFGDAVGRSAAVAASVTSPFQGDTSPPTGRSLREIQGGGGGGMRTDALGQSIAASAAASSPHATINITATTSLRKEKKCLVDDALLSAKADPPSAASLLGMTQSSDSSTAAHGTDIAETNPDGDIIPVLKPIHRHFGSFHSPFYVEEGPAGSPTRSRRGGGKGKVNDDGEDENLPPPRARAPSGILTNKNPNITTFDELMWSGYGMDGAAMEDAQAEMSRLMDKMAKKDLLRRAQAHFDRLIDGTHQTLAKRGAKGGDTATLSSSFGGGDTSRRSFLSFGDAKKKSASEGEYLPIRAGEEDSSSTSSGDEGGAGAKLTTRDSSLLLATGRDGSNYGGCDSNTASFAHNNNNNTKSNNNQKKKSGSNEDDDYELVEAEAGALLPESSRTFRLGRSAASSAAHFLHIGGKNNNKNDIKVRYLTNGKAASEYRDPAALQREDKYPILFQTMALVGAALALKYVLQSVYSFHGYISLGEIGMVFTGLFFIQGIVFGSATGDLKAAQALPGKVVVILEEIEDHFMYASRKVLAKNLTLSYPQALILHFSDTWREYLMYQQEKSYWHCELILREVVLLAALWDSKGANVSKVTELVGKLREPLSTAAFIHRSKYLPATYILLLFFVTTASILMFLVQFNSYTVMFGVTASVLTVIWFTLRLIKALENPFNVAAPKGMRKWIYGHMAAVQIFQLNEYIEKLDHRRRVQKRREQLMFRAQKEVGKENNKENKDGTNNNEKAAIASNPNAATSIGGDKQPPAAAAAVVSPPAHGATPDFVSISPSSVSAGEKGGGRFAVTVSSGGSASTVSPQQQHQKQMLAALASNGTFQSSHHTPTTSVSSQAYYQQQGLPMGASVVSNSSPSSNSCNPSGARGGAAARRQQRDSIAAADPSSGGSKSRALDNWRRAMFANKQQRKGSFGGGGGPLSGDDEESIDGGYVEDTEEDYPVGAYDSQ